MRRLVENDWIVTAVFVGLTALVLGLGVVASLLHGRDVDPP
jgi:hypothetical protein